MPLEIHPERTIELTDLDKDDRERLRPWVGVGLLLAVGMILALLGCAPQDVPVCEKYQAQIVQNEAGDPGIFLDMPNVKKLAKLITGLQDGSCRIAPPETQGKPM